MKKYIAVVLMVLVPVTAHAAMQDMLNNMFMSNITQAGAFQTQNRAGFVGGSVQLRAPVKPITLAAFDPPRFNAGCGGLDMYGGSFSFINANQITALFRQIMSNAIGLMFQAAIKAINPMIADLVNYFQDVVNGLNKMSSNTCAIAHKVTDFMFDPNSKTNDAQDSWSDFGATVGSFSDRFTGKFATAAEQKTNAANAESSPEVANVGNLTWRALRRSKASDKLDFFPVTATTGGISDDDYKDQIIMSMIGSQIVSVAQSDANSTQTPVPLNRKLKLTDLVGESLSPQAMKVWSCQPAPAASGLVSPAADQWGDLGCPVAVEADLEFSGTRAYIANMLYGDAAQTNPAVIATNAVTYHAGNPMAGSILDKLQHGDTATLSAAQVQFLRFFPGPVARIIINAQSDPANYSTIFPYLESYAAVSMAVSIGEGVEKAARAAWDGVKGIPQPMIVSESLKELDDELRDLRNQKRELSNNVKVAYDLASAVRRDNRSTATP